MSLSEVTIGDFNNEILKGFKVKELKDFIKEKKLVKPRGLTKKQHFIDFLIREKEVVYGLREQDIELADIAEEKTSIYDMDEVIVGIDEAGQGCCAGELYIGVAILPKSHLNNNWKHINDSKKLSKDKKDILFKYVKEIAIEYVIHKVTIEDIDTLNIFQAKMIGFHRALDKIKTRFDHILVDGDKFRTYKTEDGFIIPHTCVIKGDGIYKSIAAASILAKTQRDADMIALAPKYPEFNWERNKGYCTLEHFEKIKKYGVTKHHRRSYAVCKDWEEHGLYEES